MTATLPRQLKVHPWRLVPALVPVMRRHPTRTFLLIAGLSLIVVTLAGDQMIAYAPDRVGFPRLLAPSLSTNHPFGTDNLGRDMFSRIMSGGQISLGVAITSVVCATLVGAACGIVAGYVGGVTDLVLSRLLEVIMAFPPLLFAMFFLSVFAKSFAVLCLVIAALFVPATARVVRAAAISVRSQPYMEAAIVVGASPIRVLVFYVLPNVAAPIIVVASLQLGAAILAESSLSFLGLGISTDSSPSWGKMLNDSRGVWLSAWWMWAVPGAAISLSVLVVNILGDELRDVLDPRLRA